MGQDVLSRENCVSKEVLETKREYLGKEDEPFYEAGPWSGASGGRQLDATEDGSREARWNQIVGEPQILSSHVNSVCSVSGTVLIPLRINSFKNVCSSSPSCR